MLGPHGVPDEDLKIQWESGKYDLTMLHSVYLKGAAMVAPIPLSQAPSSPLFCLDGTRRKLFKNKKQKHGMYSVVGDLEECEL